MAQVPALQQPPEHGWPGPQLGVHCLLVRLHAVPAGQSVELLQPHSPPRPDGTWQIAPTVAALHCTHAAPLSPQALTSVPAVQLPDEQQPPLQSCVGEHWVTHWCVVTLQAVCSGQSADVLQPHTPATQMCPVALAVQSTHAPAVPQVAGSVPSLQVPLAQQPPLQAMVGEQLVVQVCATESHA
jgi:hypothetical protein